MPTVTESTDAAALRRVSLRRGRYDAQRVVWRISDLKSGAIYKSKSGEMRQSSRLSACGRFVRDDAAGVTVRVSDTPSGARAGFSGLQTCGSVWACTVCSEKVNAGRQAQLEDAITRWQLDGGTVEFGTATMRHHAGQSLTELWSALSPAWNRTTTGAGVQWNGSKPGSRGRTIGDRTMFGIAHVVRLVEVKHGEHGWHPHVHFLLFLTGKLTDQQRADLEGRMFGRWSAALGKAGYSALREVGMVLKPVESAGAALADYFTKNTYTTTPGAAAYEVTGSQSKRAGKGGRTPFELLSSLVVNESTGEVSESYLADLALWHEWEKASAGRRQITGLGKLLKALGSVEELATDLELAEAESLQGEEAVTIRKDEWGGLAMARRRVELLEAGEARRLGHLLAAWGATVWSTTPAGAGRPARRRSDPPDGIG